MNTYKLSNVSLTQFRQFLSDIGCVCVSTSGGHEKWKKEGCLAQFQRLFSDINLHVMSLRFGDFRVGTTDFVFVTWIHSRCEEATTRFEAQDG